MTLSVNTRLDCNFRNNDTSGTSSNLGSALINYIHKFASSTPELVTTLLVKASFPRPKEWSTRTRNQSVPKLRSSKKESIQIRRTMFSSWTHCRLTCQFLIRRSGNSGWRGTSRNAVYRSVYQRDINWREKSSTLAYRFDTYPHKSARQEWTNIVAPLAIEHCLRAEQVNFTDCEESHFPTFHQNSSKCNYIRFRCIRTRDSATHSTIFPPPSRI